MTFLTNAHATTARGENYWADIPLGRLSHLSSPKQSVWDHGEAGSGSCAAVFSVKFIPYRITLKLFAKQLHGGTMNFSMARTVIFFKAVLTSKPVSVTCWTARKMD